MNSWLTVYIAETGDQDPTSHTIYIPKYITKTSLYLMFKSACISRGLRLSELPSSSSFFSVFDKYFGHVKFLKQTILGRCDFCMSIPAQKSKITSELDSCIYGCLYTTS